jgi:hypothetical protein
MTAPGNLSVLMGSDSSHAFDQEDGGTSDESHYSFTYELAQRLATLSDPFFLDLADRILRCATNEEGYRCGSQICPRCSRRYAIKRRENLERRFRVLPDDCTPGMLTLQLGAASTLARKNLRFALNVLRRLVCMRWLLAGQGQIEIEPSKGASPDLNWNIHVHIATVSKTKRIPIGRIKRAWQHICGGLGRVHYQRFSKTLFNSASQTFSALAYYVTKRERAKDWLQKDASGHYTFSDDQLREVVTAIHGQRLNVTFGNHQWPTKERMRHNPRENAQGVPPCNPASKDATKPAKPHVQPSTTTATSNPSETGFASHSSVTAQSCSRTSPDTRKSRHKPTRCSPAGCTDGKRFPWDVIQWPPCLPTTEKPKAHQTRAQNGGTDSDGQNGTTSPTNEAEREPPGIQSPLAWEAVGAPCSLEGSREPRYRRDGKPSPNPFFSARSDARAGRELGS